MTAGGPSRARRLFEGSESEIGGALEFLAANPEWQGVFLRMAQAGPAGPLPRETYEAIMDGIVPVLRAERFDAHALFIIAFRCGLTSSAPE